MDWESVTYSGSAFIAALFLLEWGADRFVDHTIGVARRLGVSPVLVSLLTAGAEWEELAVVVAAVSQNRPRLALGNIVGASISNILGAFALGIIFHPGQATFDRSSKIYATVLLVLTTLFVIFLFFLGAVERIAGGVLILLFVVYVLSIAHGIYKGVVDPPEDSDSDSEAGDSSSDSDSERGDFESESLHRLTSSTSEKHELGLVRNGISQPLPPYGQIQHDSDEETGSSSSTLLEALPESTLNAGKLRPVQRRKPGMLRDVCQLVLGFAALTLSCYVLSHSIATLGDEFGLSDGIVGATILSLATTLPEKFIAIIGGAKGYGGIVVANTAGGNIFLLTLCSGILFLTADLESIQDGYNLLELILVWISAAIFCFAVYRGAGRKMGIALFVLYVVFLIAELSVFG